MSLEKIIKNCAGIDIGSEKVFVAVENQPVRNFRTFTTSYRELLITFPHEIIYTLS